MVTASSIVVLQSNGSGQLPKTLRIFKHGDNPSTKGNFRVGEKTYSRLEANQREHGFERVAIDYNHSTVPGSPDYVPGKPAAVFGYGNIEARRGEGVFLTNIEWTPLGRENAQNYIDFSPAVSQQGDEVDFVHSLALTPNGCLRDSEVAKNLVNNSATTASPAARQVKGLRGIERMVAGFNRQMAELRATNTPKRWEPSTKSELVEALLTLHQPADLDGNPLTRLQLEGFSVADLKSLRANVPRKVKGSAYLEYINAHPPSNSLSLLHSTDAGKEPLIDRLITLHSTVNPDTGQLYTRDELCRLSLGDLRILAANSPRKLHGRDLFLFAQEQQKLSPKII